MKSFELNGFTFFDSLEESQTLSFPDSLILDRTPTSESILLRLLLGSLNILHHDIDEIVYQNISYTIIRDSFENNTSQNPVNDWLTGEFGLIDLDIYFKNNRKNKQLYDELLTEFSLYFISKSRNNNVVGFLHLYRALEYMSYSFPMTYSAKTSNIYLSFDTFKSFFTNKDTGQLKFFTEFVSSIFDKSRLKCYVKIDTAISENLLDKNKKKIITSLCSDFKYFDDGYVISIQYKDFLSFIINLRNRYFHFQSDRSANISNINFQSEIFFESINDKIANWLSLIFQEILIQGVYKLNLTPVR